MAATRKLRKVRGSESITQLEHLDAAGSKIVTQGILVPGEVISADISAGGVLVGEGSICRIKVTADTYISFGNDPASMPAVTSATTPGLLLPAGIHLVVATDEFIRASAAVARLEVVS